MAPKLPRDEVARIAALARLELTDAELETFGAELGTILTFASAIQRVDTSGVNLDASVEAPPAWRADEPAPSLARDEVLGAARDTDAAGGVFRVPKVV